MYFLQNGRFLDQIGHNSSGFLMQNLTKITWEQCVFEKIDDFSIKYGHESGSVF